MAVAGLLPGAAQRDVLQDRAVVADHRRLADDDAGAVVQHDADADAGRRIDVDGEAARALALQVEREVTPALLPKLMREAVRDQRVEALEVEQGLDVAAAGRVAVVDGGEIRTKRPTELPTVGQYLAESLGDQAGVHIGMVEPLRQAMADGILKAVLAQDGRVDEPGERRLAAHDLLGLAAHLIPDRVDGGDADSLGPLRCASHGYLPQTCWTWATI